jgi:hypothetical protein
MATPHQAPSFLETVDLYFDRAAALTGLEETLIGAYRQIRESTRQDARVKDLRTAAFLNALRKIATSYQELGIFP